MATAKKATPAKPAAPAKAAPAAVLNLAVLGAIVTAFNASQDFYVSQADGQPLVDAGMIEVNTDLVDATGNAAARPTQAGINHMNSQPGFTGQADEEEQTFDFDIEDDVPLPDNIGRAKGRKYPFEKMEVGTSFFVPVTDENPMPWKAVSSNVTAINKKFAGERHYVQQTQKDEDDVKTGVRVWRKK